MKGQTPSHPPEARGLVAALAAFLVWGLSPAYFKALSPTGPLEVLAWRIAGSAVLLGIYVLAAGRGREVVESLSDRRRAAIFLATTLLVSTNWVLYIWAVNTGRILEASLGYFVNPLVNVLLGVAFLRERLDRWQGVAVGLAAVGVGSLVVAHGRLPWVSLTLAATFGFYALLRKKARIDAVVGLLVETSILAPLAVAWLAWLWWRGEAHFGASTPLSLLLLAAGPVTAFPLVWFAVAVQQLRLSTMGLLQYLAPTLQFLLAVLVYREPFSPAHAVAFGLIWASLALYTGDALAKARASAAGRVNAAGRGAP